MSIRRERLRSFWKDEKGGLLQGMSTEEIGSYFNEIADRWDGMNHCSGEKLRRIVALAGIQKGDKVLDLACGTGVLTGYLLEATPHVTGLDLAENMVALARKKYADTSACFLCGDFYSFQGKCFDAIILHNAYPHFEDKEKLVLCLARALERGGRLVVAHSLGKDHLNRVHQGRVGNLCRALRAVEVEADLFKDAFSIDYMADEEDFYAFSGTKIGKFIRR